MSTYKGRRIGLTAATVILGLGSIIESLVLRIELTDDALIATDLLGRKRYRLRRADISRPRSVRADVEAN